MNVEETREEWVNYAPKRKVEKEEDAFESKTRAKQVARETRAGNFRDNRGRVQRACIISRRVIIMRKANPIYLLCVQSERVYSVVGVECRCDRFIDCVEL